MSRRWRSLAVISIVIGQLVLAQPALAVSVADYFTFSVDVTINKIQVIPGETFQIAITARADCVADLPIPVSDCQVDGRLVGVQRASGQRTVLSSYEFQLSPFPRAQGDSVQASYTVDTKLPEGAEPGVYDLVAELIDARIKAVAWIGVASFLPGSETVGSILLLPGTVPGNANGPDTTVKVATVTLSAIPNISRTSPAGEPSGLTGSMATATPIPPPSGSETLSTGVSSPQPPAETGVAWWLLALIGGGAAAIIGLLVRVSRRP